MEESNFQRQCPRMQFYWSLPPSILKQAFLQNYFKSHLCKFQLLSIYYRINRRMKHNSSLPTIDRLVSKLDLNHSTTLFPQDPKSSKFDKYNRSLYLQNYRSFRATRAQRFKKHNNLVQTNKQNIMKLNTMKTKPPFKLHLTPTKSQLPYDFHPKSQQDILDRHPNYPLPSNHTPEITSLNLQSLLRKNKMKNYRNLLGFNILQLEKRYDFSRFELHSLYSTFNTLLLSSKESIANFRDNFEVMLNMNKITVRPEVLQKIFKQQDKITFQRFIEMYSKIDEVIFKQNIIDYIEILFEGIYNKDNIRFEDIVRIMKNRITEKEAVDIAKIIYQQNDRSFDTWIKLSQITQLCHCCENFSKKMYRIYTSELKCD